jgi:hypothetical protein
MASARATVNGAERVVPAPVSVQAATDRRTPSATAPVTSARAVRRGGSPAGSERHATARASPASGRFTRKMSRQSNAERRPPRSGPIAAPMLVVAPEMPK